MPPPEPTGTRRRRLRGGRRLHRLQHTGRRSSDPKSTSGIVYGASGGGSSAIELVHNGTVTVVAVAGAGGGRTVHNPRKLHHGFEKAPTISSTRPCVSPQTAPALPLAAATPGPTQAKTTTARAACSPWRALPDHPPHHHLGSRRRPAHQRHRRHPGPRGRTRHDRRSPPRCTRCRPTAHLQDMTTPWFENIEFPPYYSYDGDSIITGLKGTGGSDATSATRDEAVRAPLSPTNRTSTP